MPGSKTSGNKDTRTRNWTIVVYPESAPENWRDILDDFHIEWVESPLHDKDMNADNTVKKPHWHILLMFGAIKSYEQVKELTDKLTAPIPERCHNSKAMVRYMVHMDNPEKYQYDKADIKAHGGVDLAELLRPSSSERYELIKEMIVYIRDNNVTEFQDLMDYACANEFERWFPLLCDNSAYVVGQYIKSQRHRYDKVNTETGEVIDDET